MSKPLSVSSLLYYLTEVHEDLAWRQEDWTAFKIVKAIKGNPIKGYFLLKINGKEKRFEQSNIQEFLPILFKTVGAKLSQSTQGPIDVVPIPNSTAIAANQDDFKTWAHAREICGAAGDRFQVVPAIRWKEAKQPAHEGGSRDPQVHLQNMKLVLKPTRPVVLFDDVMTTGSQMIAAYRLLEKQGIVPAMGIVIGRTTKEQKVPAIGWHQEDLETAEISINWSEFFKPTQ